MRNSACPGTSCMLVISQFRIGIDWHRTGSLQSQILVWGPVLIFPSSPANLVSDKSLLVIEYAKGKLGGIWLSPTSCLGTGGFLYPGVWPSVSSPLL